MSKRKTCSGVKSISAYFKRREQPKSPELEQDEPTEVEQPKPSETDQPKPSERTEAASPVSIRDESFELPETDDRPLPQVQQQVDSNSFDDVKCSADDNNLKNDVVLGPSSSFKTKNPKKTVQKFSVSWQSQLKWVAPSTKSKYLVYCKICGKHISCVGGLPDLKKHGNRSSHLAKERLLNVAVVVDPFVSRAKNIKEAEMQICAWAAQHNRSPLEIEEITKLMKNVCLDSQISKGINLGRTKATSIIKNVIGKTHVEELVSIMRSNAFSLMIDESTDVSTKKNLVMVIRTYSWSDEKLILRDYFYHVLELAEADAITIHGAITAKFKEDGIPYEQNLVGFGADGANVMMGGSHSVAVLLKKECPNLFVLKCVCHSFALCASYACKHIPASIESVCKEIYAFLSNSPLRTAKFDQLQTIMDLKPLKMLHPAATRWLSLEQVVNRMLERLPALKVYFNFHDSNVDTKQAEKMKLISDILANPMTELCLRFLEFVLPKVNKLNRLFQSEAPQIFRLNSELVRLVKEILDNFMNPEYIAKLENLGSLVLQPRNYCELEKVYMGIGVEKHLNDVLSSNSIKHEDVQHFRKMAMNFYITLVNQIVKRINMDDTVLLNLTIIDPKNVKKKLHRSMYPLLRLFPNIINEADMQLVDDEFREVRNIHWPMGTNFDDGVEFWGMVLANKRMNGEIAFSYLRRIVPTLLSLPHSSAAVERIFSSCNLNKNKLRNRMDASMLQGILASKEYAKSHQNEKGIIEITKTAFGLFSSNMYEKTQ